VIDARLLPLRERLWNCPFINLREAWKEAIKVVGPASLGRIDRYFLLTVLLHRADAWHPWLYDRCREVEREPDDMLDLWGRYHYKSSIITFAGVIQEILNDPEITVGIFSHTKSIARGFVSQIKQEFESNKELHGIYPTILWANPSKDAPWWSLDGGLVVKRFGNPKEATIEGHGLVDGMPTAKHFKLRVYDDVVTLESVSTPEQVEKTTHAWALSDNLGMVGGRRWTIGTRYSFIDTYQYMLSKGILKPRIYPSTDNGRIDGKPVLFPVEHWDKIRETQPDSIIAAQHLQNPAAGGQAMFDQGWLKFTDIRPATLNIYILCDPAHSKNKGTDDTAVAVIGVDGQSNRYLLDGACHKMGLRERWEALRGFWTVWSRAPGVQSLRVGYERYGMQADMEYFEERQKAENLSFTIDEVAWPRDDTKAKQDRIQRLQPDFKSGKFYLIADSETETRNQKRMRDAGEEFRILTVVKQRDHEGNIYSLNKKLLDEYLVYCGGTNQRDNMLDAMSRLYDMDPVPPVIVDQRLTEPEVYSDVA